MFYRVFTVQFIRFVFFLKLVILQKKDIFYCCIKAKAIDTIHLIRYFLKYISNVKYDVHLKTILLQAYQNKYIVVYKFKELS